MSCRMTKSLLPIALTLAAGVAGASLLAAVPRDGGRGLPIAAAEQPPLQRLAAEHLPEVVPPAGWDGRRDSVSRMTVHHTASGAESEGRRVDVDVIAGWHRARGMGGDYRGRDAAAYHFVILPDGSVQSGRPLNVQGGGTRDREDNRESVGVVLVGDFEPSHNRGRLWPDRPTEEQMRSLEQLALWAMSTFGFDSSDVRGHGEVSATACPGEAVDMEALRGRLAQRARGGERGEEPPVKLIR